MHFTAYEFRIPTEVQDLCLSSLGFNGQTTTTIKHFAGKRELFERTFFFSIWGGKNLLPNPTKNRTHGLLRAKWTTRASDNEGTSASTASIHADMKTTWFWAAYGDTSSSFCAVDVFWCLFVESRWPCCWLFWFEKLYNSGFSLSLKDC